MDHCIYVQISAEKTANVICGSPRLRDNILVLQIVDRDVWLSRQPRIELLQLSSERIHKLLIGHAIGFLPMPKHNLLRSDNIFEVPFHKDHSIFVVARQPVKEDVDDLNGLVYSVC